MLSRKNILIGFLSLLLILYLVLLDKSGLESIFSLSLPIAIHGFFPIPVFFWLGVLVYLLLSAYFLKTRFSNIAKKWIGPGILMHLLLMLFKLKVFIIANPQVFSSPAYKIYCELFIFTCFGVLASFCARHILELDVFSFPFFVLLAYIAASLLFNRSIFYFLGLFFIFIIYLSWHIYNPFDVSTIKKIRELFINEKLFLAVIFFAGLLIRIFYLCRIMSAPDYLSTGSDGPLYDGLAQSFLRGEKVTEPLVSGYWMFLALIYKLFGRSYFLVGFIQSILTSLSCIFVYYTAKYIFNIKAARIAAILAVVSFSSIFSSVAIGHQGLDIFYSTLPVMLVARYVYTGAAFKSSFVLLIFTGIVFGLSIATREVNFFYPLIVLFWLFLYFRRTSQFKQIVIGSAVVFFSIIAALSPFAYRNLKNLGVVYPISASDGAGYPLIEHYLKGENPQLIKEGIDLSRPGKLFQLTIRRPVFVTRIIGGSLVKRFKEMYFSQGYGGFDPLFLYRLSSYYYSLWFYVYALTIFGVILAFRNYGWGPHCLIFLFITYRTMVHFVTEGSYRHRAPIEPFLLLYLIFGIYMLVLLGRNQPVNVHE